MINTTHTSMSFLAIGWMILSLGLSPGYCDDAIDSSQSKHYYADTKLFSMKPDGGLQSYRNHGGGGVGPRGTLGLDVSSGDRDFDVTIRASKKRGRFAVRVTVKPKKNDSHTTAIDRVIDLTELAPHRLELARDDDSRVYHLSLFPYVTETPVPTAFSVADLRFEQWSFRDSQIILNDQEYLGQINLHASSIAWIDIPGLAKVEFSLLPLTEAAKEGVLNNGTICITHNNETRIRITNVRNGVEPKVLHGGPYYVWVRWMEPSQTVEQYRESWKKQLATIKQQIKSGDLDLPQGTVDRLERMAQSDRILQVSCGVRGPRKGEILPTSH